MALKPMIVACVATRGESGGMLPQENFEFRPFQIASDAIWDKPYKQHFDGTYVCRVTLIANIDDTTVITILNFKISGGGEKFWLGNSSPPSV